MSHIQADGIRETSTTTGTGTLNLAGNVANFRDCNSVMASADTGLFAARMGSDIEIFLGTFTDAAPDTLARTTIIASTNGGAAVDWGAGTKDVYMLEGSWYGYFRTVFALMGDISPAQITANQNDYNPTGLSTAAVLRLTSDASRNITSITGGTDGRVLVIHNVGSFNIVLTDDDGATGTAANRFALSESHTLLPDASAVIQYDSTSSRWRMIGAGISLAAVDFLVKTASASLSAERVVTDTPTIVVDWATAGQAKFNVVDGTIVGRAYAEYTANSDLTTVLPADDTIPQNTEGTEILTTSLAPKTATNRVRITFTGMGTVNGVAGLSAALFIDSVADAVRAAQVTIPTADYRGIVSLVYEYVPGTTSSVTYKIRVGPSVGTARMNGLTSARLFGGTAACTLVVEEIKAS